MTNTRIPPAERDITALEDALLGVKVDEIPRLLPGLVATSALAWISIWLSDYVGTALMGFEKSPISAVMVAVLLGMIISNAMVLPALFRLGLQFSVRKVLRLGIIFLGIRLSVSDVFELGVLGVPIVVLCIGSALYATTRLNKWLSLPDRLGTLIAVGTSICGVSAIVATAPAIEAEEEEVAYAVAVITVFGIAAMLIYPYLAYTLFDGDPVQAGLFLGTSIHETAQVAGAGFLFADTFGLSQGLDVATVAKLVRNVFMAAVIPVMALYHTRSTSLRGTEDNDKISFMRLFPVFVLGFLAFAVLRSIGDAGISTGGEAFGVWDQASWEHIHNTIQEWAGNFMVIALAGVGLSTRFHILRGLGVRPFVVGLGAAVLVGAVSVIAIFSLTVFATV